MEQLAKKLKNYEFTLLSDHMIVDWDDSNWREVEEAKSYYRLARAQHRRIVDIEGNPVDGFRPYLQWFQILEPDLKSTQLFTRILNEKGDESVIWDSNDPKEVEETAGRFKEYLDKGWRAYAVSQDGKTKRRVLVFNPLAEEIVFVDPVDATKSIKETLKGFAAKFKTVWMTPRTWPG